MSLAAAVRVVVCASILLVAPAGALADEYRAEDNRLSMGSFPQDSQPDPLTTYAYIVGLGTVLGLLMGARTNRGPAHPKTLRHVEAGYRRYSEREDRIHPPRLSR